MKLSENISTGFQYSKYRVASYMRLKKKFKWHLKLGQNWLRFKISTTWRRGAIPWLQFVKNCENFNKSHRPQLIESQIAVFHFFQDFLIDLHNVFLFFHSNLVVPTFEKCEIRHKLLSHRSIDSKRVNIVITAWKLSSLKLVTLEAD